MRAKFLFWNVRRARGTRFAECLTRLAAGDTDVFLFAEPPDDSALLASALNAQTSNNYEPVPAISSRVRFFVRNTGPLAGAEWHDRYYDGIYDRITAIECLPQDALGFLIVGTHLESPNHMSADGRAEWARDVARDVRTVETDINHERTVLVGDLNMNPYDGGLVQTSALHGLMSRQLVNAVANHGAREGYGVFYNAMWSCLGDRPAARIQPNGRSRPPGTFYYDQTKDRANTFWQTFDQVLLRPAIMDRLTYLEVLAGDGVEPFVTPDGKPRADTISDHLPLAFELDL